MSSPSPRSMPELWDTCVIGAFTLPPVKQRGSCKVSVTPSLKKDDKKKAGKDGAKPAIERIEPDKIEVEFQWNEEIWPQVAPIITGLKPDGTPRDIFHPLTDVYGDSSFLIEQASPVEFNNGVMSITWSGEAWKAPAASGQQLILRRGSTGTEVTRWQTFLTEQRFGEPEGFSPIDGIFGILTEDGTKGFQTRESIKVDGIVGPETFGAAAKYGYAPPPPVKGGSGGGGVKTPDASEDATWSDFAEDATNSDLADLQNDAAEANVNAVEEAARDFLGGGENGDDSSGSAAGEGSGSAGGG